MLSKEEITIKNILIMKISGVNSLSTDVILKDNAVLAHALSTSKLFASEIFNGTIPVSKLTLEKTFLYMINNGLFTEDFYLSLPAKHQTNHKILKHLFTEKQDSTQWITKLDLSKVNFNLKNAKLLCKFDLETYIEKLSNKYYIYPFEIALNMYPTIKNFKTFIKKYRDSILDFKFNDSLGYMNSSIFKHYTSDILLELYNKDNDKFINLIKNNYSYSYFKNSILPIEVYNHPDILFSLNSLNEYFFLNNENLKDEKAFDVMHDNSNKHNQLFNNIAFYFAKHLTQNLKHDFILFQGESEKNEIHKNLDELYEITEPNIFFENLKNNFKQYNISLSSIFLFANPILKNNHEFVANFLTLNNKFQLPEDNNYTKKNSTVFVSLENYQDIPDNLIKKIVQEDFYNALMIINNLREDETKNIEKILFVLDILFSDDLEIVNSKGHIFSNKIDSHKIVILLSSLKHYKETLEHLDMTLDEVSQNFLSLELSIEAMQALYHEKKMQEDIQLTDKIQIKKTIKF